MRIPQIAVNILLAPLLLAGAAVLVKVWIANKPPARSRPPMTMQPRVAYLESRAAEHTPTISTYGTVQAYQQTRLASQVAGKIETVSEGFRAGRAISAGEELVTIEEDDFRAEVARQESALAAAARALAEEESRARIAEQDWIDSGMQLEEAPDFTLRKPQLAAARADHEAAKEALRKAELDLARTRITAPFDAIVQERSASPGNVVNSGTILGTLIDRSQVEVRLPLTPEQASRLRLPLVFAKAEGEFPPLTATLQSPSRPGPTWRATITRTEPSLDPTNQVLYVVAEVPAPFDDPDAFLPIGTYVEARITGSPIPGVHQLPESALIEDRFVWVITADNTLRRQPVERVFSTNGSFLATIDDPVATEPLRIATRPLVSFSPGNEVIPVDPNAPAPPPGKGPGGPGRGPGGRPPQ